MNGLQLSEKYYFEAGKPLLEREFPELLPFLAAGLAGEGSDCLGYDDGISRDHDFGPGFCLWLPEEQYRAFGPALQAAYDRLPRDFAGFSARKNDPNSGKRVGVFSIEEFYSRFIGRELPPFEERRWYLFSDDRLAAAVSGKVFEDPCGKFSEIREALLSYYPERIRIRKIANCVHLLSQAGQYNYARCMERGDTMAAEFALHEFLRETIHLIHFLSRKYEPYYKWAWRSFLSLPSSGGLAAPLKELAELPVQTEAWKGTHGPFLNYKDQKVLLIEQICRRLLLLLKEEGLTAGTSDFLDAHAAEIASHAG